MDGIKIEEEAWTGGGVVAGHFLSKFHALGGPRTHAITLESHILSRNISSVLSVSLLGLAYGSGGGVGGERHRRLVILLLPDGLDAAIDGGVLSQGRPAEVQAQAQEVDEAPLFEAAL